MRTTNVGVDASMLIFVLVWIEGCFLEILNINWDILVVNGQGLRLNGLR